MSDIQGYTGRVFDTSRIDLQARGLPTQAKPAIDAAVGRVEEQIKDDRGAGGAGRFSILSFAPLADSAPFQSAAEAVLNGDTPSIDDLRAVASEMLRVVLRSEMSGPAVAVGDSFTVELTDDEFVLYSAGFNGEPDRALRVGPGGDDILYWPPMLSLVRAQASP